jgi:hypothetical protein
MSQVVTRGTVIAVKPNMSFCTVNDGYFTVDAYIPGGVTIKLGSTYQLYKQNNTYFIGQEIKIG